jgi:hypothetical protein
MREGGRNYKGGNKMNTVKRHLVILFIITVFFSVSAQNVSEAADRALFIEKGHSIRIDGDISDWVGLPSLEENTATVDKGEFIWKDAKGDDTGDGNYVYPTDIKLQRGADLREFRVTYDEERLYLLIKTDRPNDWWVRYLIIGIDQTGAGGVVSGATVLAQGDLDTMDPYSGCFGEIKVAEELGCEIIIGISSTYKVKVWDEHGNLLASVAGEEEQVPGLKIADDNWYALELALPYEIIGDPRSQTWRFIVGSALQDGDRFREVHSGINEWHPGGSRVTANVEHGVEPDVFDLIGASREKQIEDLSSYDPHGRPGDPDAFATIRHSYVTVRFGE